MITNFTIVAFTHKSIDLADLGYLSLDPERILKLSPNLKQEFFLDEFFLLNTCNRIELVFTTKEKNTSVFDIRKFILFINPDIPTKALDILAENARIYEAYEAMNHILKVSCSMDSMVVGEKEILAQLRLAYDRSREAGFTGEILRLVMNLVVKAAKEVYTHTKISEKPISVVSIAFRKLASLKLDKEANILMIGAGKTNTLFSKYLVKHGFKNFHIFNRTLSNGEILAREINGKAYPLKDLNQFQEGFDLMVVCTDSSSPVIDTSLYNTLISSGKNLRDKKIIIDLSVPSGIDSEIIQKFPVHFIDIKSLQDLASENMDERYKELYSAEKIIEANLVEFNLLLKTRKVELAMKEVPQMIKEIKEMALSTIFAKDIDQMDDSSKMILEKVLNYMEKKYISIPMVLAKEILVNS